MLFLNALIVSHRLDTSGKGVVLSWNASYFRPQSEDVVRDLMSKKEAKGLNYTKLSSFLRKPSYEVVSWVSHLDHSKSYLEFGDIRLAFDDGEGTFEVNRYGFVKWKPTATSPTSFDVGAFLEVFRKDERVKTTFINQTNKSIILFAINGIYIGTVNANSVYVWKNGWNIGVMGKGENRECGLIGRSWPKRDPYTSLPPFPGVKIKSTDRKQPFAVTYVIQKDR